MPNLHGYKASDYENERNTVPPGDYAAKIVASEINPNKSGNGKVLKLTWEIMSTSHAGIQVLDWINIEHANKQCQNIGRRELGDICRAIGINEPRDTEALHEKKIGINVVNAPDSDFPKVKDYFRLPGPVPAEVAESELPPVTEPQDIPF